MHLEVDDGVGVVRLDRPPANAIDLQLGLELQAAIAEAGERDEVGAIVVWGGPRSSPPAPTSRPWRRGGPTR